LNGRPVAGDGRFDRIGRARLIACSTVKANVLLAEDLSRGTAARTVSRLKRSKSSREKACSQALAAEEEIGRESARSGGAISRALENAPLAHG